MAEQYSNLAYFYDSLNIGCDYDALANFVDLTIKKNEKTPSKLLLDLACGTGKLTFKLREKGYLIVFNPVAECYHHESISRGYDNKGAKKARMEREKQLLRERWPAYYVPGGDPYYNPNFGQNSISYDA